MYRDRLHRGNIGASMNVDPRRTHYNVLMLDSSADAEIIGVVYRRLAHRYHPDVDSSAEAAQKMLELNAAREVLGNPEKRRRYDAELAARRDRRATDRLVRGQGDVTYGTAGKPPGRPNGSLIDFGRYSGWTLGEIRHRDPDYLEWLANVPAGRQYRDEIRVLLAQP